MSNGVETLSALKERIERNERRMEQQDTFRHELRESVRQIELNYAVLITQLENLSADVEDQGKDTSERLKSLNKGVYAAGVLLVSLAGLILKGQVG